MPEDLQSLLEKINQDGIMKAETEKQRIIAEAEKTAAAIIAEAESKAEKMISDADRKCSDALSRAKEALEQNRRDILLQLREELAARLNNAVQDTAAQALSPEFMAQLIKEIALAFSAAPDSVITVRSSVKDAAALEKALCAALADSFSAKPQLFSGREIASGMEISFDGGKCYYDFTIDAISDLLNEFIGDKLQTVFQA
jgi:V/A-type H+-transporting ATPase subunit E